MKKKNYLGAARILQVPKLDVSVTHGNEVIAIFREAHGLYFTRHFVGRDLNIAPPVPDIDDHVVLRADRNDVLVAGGKCLRKRDREKNKKTKR